MLSELRRGDIVLYHGEEQYGQERPYLVVQYCRPNLREGKLELKGSMDGQLILGDAEKVYPVERLSSDLVMNDVVLVTSESLLTSSSPSSSSSSSTVGRRYHPYQIKKILYNEAGEILEVSMHDLTKELNKDFNAIEATSSLTVLTAEELTARGLVLPSASFSSNKLKISSWREVLNVLVSDTDRIRDIGNSLLLLTASATDDDEPTAQIYSKMKESFQNFHSILRYFVWLLIYHHHDQEPTKPVLKSKAIEDEIISLSAPSSPAHREKSSSPPQNKETSSQGMLPALLDTVPRLQYFLKDVIGAGLSTVSMITLFQQDISSYARTLAELWSIETTVRYLIEFVRQSASVVLLEACQVLAEDVHSTIDAYSGESSEYALHWLNSAVTLNISRQDWQSHSPYQRNKRNTPGVVHGMTTVRNWLSEIVDASHTQQILDSSLIAHMQSKLKDPLISVSSLFLNRVHKYCTHQLHEMLSCILAAYSTLLPSRTRLYQWQLDLSYVQFALRDALNWISRILDSSILVTAHPSSADQNRNHTAELQAGMIYLEYLLYFSQANTSIGSVIDLLQQQIAMSKVEEGKTFWSDNSDRISAVFDRVYGSLPRLSDTVGDKLEKEELVFLNSSSCNTFDLAQDAMVLNGFDIAEDIALEAHRSANTKSFALFSAAEIALYTKELAATMSPSSSHASPTSDTSTKTGVPLLACREVFFQRLINSLQLRSQRSDTTIISSTAGKEVFWTVDQEDKDAVLTRCLVQFQKELWERVQLYVPENESEEMSNQRFIQFIIDAVQWHRGALVDLKDGQAVYPALTEEEKTQAAQFRATFPP